MSEKYDIEILYREPTFDLRNPGHKEPFSWTYEVSAHSPEAALEEALAKFRSVAAESWVSWIRNVVDIRLRPSSPHAVGMDPAERSEPLTEPGGDDVLPNSQSQSMLSEIQQQLVEELLIILWTRLRDAYVHDWRSWPDNSELGRALKELDRVKLWEWSTIYDRMASHYRKSTTASRQLRLSIDREDFGSVREAWRAYFLEELKALRKSCSFVTSALTLAISCEPLSFEKERRAVEEYLERRYASKPDKATSEPEEAPRVGTLTRFLRSRRKKAAARRELERHRQEDEEQLRKKLARREHLRKQDPMVDLILKSLMLAKLDLQRLLDGMDESALRLEDLEGLLQWKRDHAVVMDFSVFEEICKYFPPPGADYPILELEEIRELLEEHCNAMNYFGYADKKLEIQRGFEYAGKTIRLRLGFRYERPDGTYEDVNRRLEPRSPRSRPRRAEVDEDQVFGVEGRRIRSMKELWIECPVFSNSRARRTLRSPQNSIEVGQALRQGRGGSELRWSIPGYRDDRHGLRGPCNRRVGGRGPGIRRPHRSTRAAPALWRSTRGVGQKGAPLDRGFLGLV